MTKSKETSTYNPSILHREIKGEGLSVEKIQWLKDIGAMEYERPMKYLVRSESIIGDRMLYSEEYIKNTPLEVLQEKYKKWKRHDD